MEKNQNKINDLLVEAAKSENKKAVEFLLDKDNFLSPLSLSAKRGQTEIVNSLLEHDIDIHANNDEALRLAVQNGHIDIVKNLLAKGASIYENSNKSILADALTYQQKDIFNLLSHHLEQKKHPGQDIESKDYYNSAQLLISNAMINLTNLQQTGVNKDSIINPPITIEVMRLSKLLGKAIHNVDFDLIKTTNALSERYVEAIKNMDVDSAEKIEEEINVLSITDQAKEKFPEEYAQYIQQYGSDGSKEITDLIKQYLKDNITLDIEVDSLKNIYTQFKESNTDIELINKIKESYDEKRSQQVSRGINSNEGVLNLIKQHIDEKTQAKPSQEPAKASIKQAQETEVEPRPYSEHITDRYVAYMKAREKEKAQEQAKGQVKKKSKGKTCEVGED